MAQHLDSRCVLLELSNPGNFFLPGVATKTRSTSRIQILKKEVDPPMIDFFQSSLLGRIRKEVLVSEILHNFCATSTEVGRFGGRRFFAGLHALTCCVSADSAVLGKVA